MTSTIICLFRCHESALFVCLFGSNWGRASKYNNWASRIGPQLLGNIQLLGFAFLDWLDWMELDEVEDEIEWNLMRLMMRLNGIEWDLMRMRMRLNGIWWGWGWDWMELMRLRMRLNGNELWKLKSKVWFGKNDLKSRPKKSLVTESGSFTLIVCVTQV